MSESKLSKSEAKIKVRLETVRYGGWDSLEVAIDCANPQNMYLTFPTVETILNWEAKRYGEKIASKSLKAFAGKALHGTKMSAIIVNKQGLGTPKVSLVALDDFQIIATWEAAVNGNIDVAKLLAVGFCDSLRSITLEQLGIVLVIEDRNEWIKTRLMGKEKRTCLTDSIKVWLECNEVSDIAKKFLYSNVSDKLNIGLTGHKAKHWRDIVGCSDNAALRDCWKDSHLERIKSVEEHATRLIVRGQTPMDAIELALEFFDFSLEKAPTA